MSAARSRIIGAIVVVGLSRVLAAQMASPIVRPSLPVAAQTSPIELAVPSLTVRFEGGDVPANASKVLRVLELQNLLETRTATIGKGQSLCDLYRELIGFPMGCTAELVQLANEMNGRNYSKQILRIGEKIEYPDVYFLKTPWTKRFDPKVDQKALEDFRRSWSRYILSEDKLATGMVKLNLEAYELRVPVLTAVDARRAATELAVAKIPNITVSHPDEQKRLLKYHSTIPPAKYVSDCQARLLQADQQCAYAFLVGLEKLDWAPCSGPCPDVFLVDRPVRRHPSLKTAVLDGFVDDLEPAPADPLCALPPLKDGDHGTHLAAIIGAAGPACVGLFPGVRLHSWNREGPDEITRADIERVQENFENNIATVGLPIFVFASSWEFTGKNGQAGARLEDTNESCVYPPCRRWRHPIADEVGNNRGALWIVAAGQPDPAKAGERPVEITNDLALGPMNLGDQPHVLVVTACLNCSGASPQLRSSVNFSKSFVHLAAPGDDVPGPAGEKRLGVGGGTSQAAAFAAGVAAAMVAKYPTSFVKPEAVKTRLQVTSHPVLQGQDLPRLATGIIDPGLALKPPNKDYWQPVIGSVAEATIENWCVASVPLKDPDTRQLLTEVSTKDILRIYRVNRDDAAAAPQWVFYTKGKRPGEVVRTGPIVFTIPAARAGQTGALFRVKGVGAPVTAGRFFDLVLHNPSGIGVASSCG